MAGWQPRISYTYDPARRVTPHSSPCIAAIVAYARVDDLRGESWSDSADRHSAIHAQIDSAGVIHRIADEHLALQSFAPSQRVLGGCDIRPAPDSPVPGGCTLGFELEQSQDGRYSTGQLFAMGWQIAEWRRQHGALPVLREPAPGSRRDAVPLNLSDSQIELWVRRAIEASAGHTFTARFSANIRAGCSRAAALVGVLNPGERWTGVVVRGEAITLPELGSSDLWVISSDNHAVWRPLLDLFGAG
ncbi:MAG: hypothetical protein OHK0022_52740 [Roseiflexaceae bacterium]